MLWIFHWSRDSVSGILTTKRKRSFKEILENNIQGNAFNRIRNIVRASKTEKFKSIPDFDKDTRTIFAGGFFRAHAQ